MIAWWLVLCVAWVIVGTILGTTWWLDLLVGFCIGFGVSVTFTKHG